jgi:hypothetical protein
MTDSASAGEPVPKTPRESFPWPPELPAEATTTTPAATSALEALPLGSNELSPHLQEREVIRQIIGANITSGKKVLT